MTLKEKWYEIFVLEAIMADLVDAGITNLFSLDYFNWCYLNDLPACALREELLEYGKRKFEAYAKENR